MSCRNEHPVGVWVVGSVRVVADLSEPVLGSPPPGVSEDQLVEDLLVYLPPGRCSVGHEGDGVSRADEVEAVVTQHRRIAEIVPVMVGIPFSLPAVGRRCLAMQVTQPADVALGQGTGVVDVITKLFVAAACSNRIGARSRLKYSHNDKAHDPAIGGAPIFL